MTATFAQLLKAYSAFNNHGLAMTPRIVNYLEDSNGTRYPFQPKYGDRQAISSQTADQIHTILKEVVKRGTGVKAQYPGLEIGGKTGTAHISNGRHGYSKEYHSSFYGFANDDKGHNYTIGVLVIRASKHHKYFAAQSAVPAFRQIVDILVDQEFLKPNLSKVQQEAQAEKERKRQILIHQKQQQRTREIKARLKAQREAIQRKAIHRQAQKRNRARIRRRTPPKRTQPRITIPHTSAPDMF